MTLNNQDKERSKNKENKESPFLQSPKSPPPQEKTSGCISSVVHSYTSAQSHEASLCLIMPWIATPTWFHFNTQWDFPRTNPQELAGFFFNHNNFLWWGTVLFLSSDKGVLNVPCAPECFGSKAHSRTEAFCVFSKKWGQPWFLTTQVNAHTLWAGITTTSHR